MLRDVDEQWRCARCGDVIGVYEPVVLLEGQNERLSSRLVEPQLDQPTGEIYHEACWHELAEE